LGIAMRTSLATRSTTGFSTLARCSAGATNRPMFSAAKPGSRPVTNTAEHITFAKPAV
jgi:hypothetical protein